MVFYFVQSTPAGASLYSPGLNTQIYNNINEVLSSINAKSLIDSKPHLTCFAHVSTTDQLKFICMFWMVEKAHPPSKDGLWLTVLWRELLFSFSVDCEKFQNFERNLGA